MRIIEKPADLHSLVGQEVAVSDWMRIDQSRINAFAAATEDQQWIHVDVERATREWRISPQIATERPLIRPLLRLIVSASRSAWVGCS